MSESAESMLARALKRTFMRGALSGIILYGLIDLAYDLIANNC